MAYKTVANLRDSVSGILQGLNLNNVKNLNVAFERTAREVAQEINLPSVQGRQNFTVYDGVVDYPGLTNIYGSALIDIRPQGFTRTTLDEVYKKFIEPFDQTKAFLPNGVQVTFEYRNGTPIMRLVSAKSQPKIELDPLNATTGWTVGGSLSSLTEDDTVYYNAPASLRFTLTGNSSGTLTKTISQTDLTNYVGVGVVFIAIQLPSANAGTDLSSISVKIGSDSSNYYSVSATQGFLGAFTVGDWLLVGLNLANATTTGTPTVTKIAYVQLTFTHGVTMTNFYVGDLWIALPNPYTAIFETAALFLASGQTTPSTTITNTADQILLLENAYVIYEYKCAMNIALQQGGTLASNMISTIDQKLNGIRGYRGILIQPGLLDLYRADTPTEEIRIIGSYY